MTSATRSLFAPFFASAPAPARDETGGDRPARRGPVFIQDAVSPWRGETLLLALLRADTERANQTED